LDSSAAAQVEPFTSQDAQHRQGSPEECERYEVLRLDAVRRMRLTGLCVAFDSGKYLIGDGRRSPSRVGGAGIKNTGVRVLFVSPAIFCPPYF